MRKINEKLQNVMFDIQHVLNSIFKQEETLINHQKESVVPTMVHDNIFTDAKPDPIELLKTDDFQVLNFSDEDRVKIISLLQSNDYMKSNDSMNISDDIIHFYELCSDYQILEAEREQSFWEGGCYDDSKSSYHYEESNKRFDEIVEMKQKIESNIKDINITEYKFASLGCKTVEADIIELPGNAPIIRNYRIKNNATGKTEPLKTGNIDLSKQTQFSVRKLLAGEKVEMTNKSGLSSMVSLNKTVTGWGISTAKQAFNSMDSSAEI